jgi:hypothetical protein
MWSSSLLTTGKDFSIFLYALLLLYCNENFHLRLKNFPFAMKYEASLDLIAVAPFEKYLGTSNI